MTTRRLLFVLLPLTAIAVAAAPAHALFKQFRTPSSKIGCYYSTGPTFLRCDTAYPTSFTNKKHGREGDYGQAFGMTRRGKANAICAGDTALAPDSAAIPYGTSRRFGPYKCTSRQSGLTCTNAAHHGWTLSRQRQKLF